ncbi:MAG: beta-glucosidase family protein [Deltaproteobacteria bacterium]|nr:beta-glucosidase family protein [Deltaproteobacteria bacterium]
MPEQSRSTGGDRAEGKPRGAHGPPSDRAGELLLLGWPGEDPEGLMSLLEEFRPAGFIYFGRNWPGSLPALRDALAKADRWAARHLGRRLLWAVDQEGGPVQRLREEGFTLPSAKEIGELAGSQGLDCVVRLANRAGLALRDLGFNLNLAPVLDVAATGAYISERSFSRDPGTAASVAQGYALGFREAGLLVCGKHFPGLGATEVDPHGRLPLVASDAQELWDRDGLPFRALIAQGVPALMTTHALYVSLDPDLPATLSPKVVGLLKGGYGFGGIVISDDLMMGGILSLATPWEAAVGAVVAGHDLVIVSKDQSAIRNSRDSLAEAIMDGRITPGRLGDQRRRLEGALGLLPGPD